MTKTPKPRSAWHKAAKAIAFSALMCAVAIGMVVAAQWFEKDVNREQAKAQAAMSASNAALQNTQSDRTRLEDNLQLFSKLQATRFTQAPDRLRLIEAMEQATKNMQKNALEWEIKPQEKIKVLNDDKTNTPVAQLVRVRMQLRANGVHEEEWLALMNQLRDSGAGYYAIDSCVYELKPYSRAYAVVPAVNTICQLSWIYAVADGPALKLPISTSAPITQPGLVSIDAAILTPTQRRNLELARKLPAFEQGPAGTAQFTELLAQEEPIAIPDKLAISGVVVRNGNRSTVWINDKPLYGEGGDTALRKLAAQSGIIQPGSKILRLQSKPGQTVDSSTREVVDLLPQGAIVVNKPAIDAALAKPQ